MLRCKSEQLPQHLLTLIIDRSQRLEDHRTKVVVRAHETGIVLPVLLDRSVILTRAGKPHASLRQRARHCHVDRKTVVVLPVRDRHVARPAISGGAKNALLLKHWLQETI
jgi:hypothetical protein